MRSIKFRYWNGYAKQMYPPEFFGLRLDGKFLVGITRKTNSVLDEKLFVPSEWHDKDALMQFTGLLDKNGKEIYEGDIVSMLSSGPRTKHQVKFRKGCFDVSLIPIRVAFVRTDPKIIGNIYENPDLLIN